MYVQDSRMPVHLVAPVPPTPFSSVLNHLCGAVMTAMMPISESGPIRHILAWQAVKPPSISLSVILIRNER